MGRMSQQPHRSGSNAILALVLGGVALAVFFSSLWLLR